MAQVIQTNVPSLNSQRNLDKSQSMQSTSLQRLSSGLRINSAKDDAAGLAISDRMTSQIRGLDQARRNANDGISLSQTAEGALSTSTDLLQRVRELAVQSSNSSNTASDRQALQSEVGQLVSELDRISTTTQFNGQNLLDGTFGAANFQVGANANQIIQATTGNFRTNVYGNNQLSGANGAGTYAPSATAFGTNGVSSGAITVSGSVGSGSISVAANATAQTIAQQINGQTVNTGVAATAKTDIDVSFGAAGAYAMNLASDNGAAGQTITFTLSATTGQSGLADAISKINDQSSKTGVTAALNNAGSGLILTNGNGNDITLTNSSTSAFAGNVTVQRLNSEGAAAGSAATMNASAAGSTTSAGYLTFDSSSSFNVTSASNAVTSSNSALRAVSGLDISTFKGAQDALKTVDSAIAAVSGQRAKFGALQSRFENTISNLQTSSENLSASRSRIRDTDFASETATLTRSQVLQQAGTAMLAQANALPNQVLSLLRG
ncbi:flagellin [Deefgea tanakiae]|uniref:Flagellin n=1 Tax=Deefgea tanakiae TaxID=2865840 RepID=A0ABX8ZA60_9NEIS|nr:flagellin [Deefgea tanakiae]QZA79202.1 flagellin [Deefgea tanakiae]